MGRPKKKPPEVFIVPSGPHAGKNATGPYRVFENYTDPMIDLPGRPWCVRTGSYKYGGRKFVRLTIIEHTGLALEDQELELELFVQRWRPVAGIAGELPSKPRSPIYYALFKDTIDENPRAKYEVEDEKRREEIRRIAAEAEARTSTGTVH
jgi:hypothetical protein